MVSVSWFEVIMWWIISISLIGIVISAFFPIISGLSSAPIFKAFLEGPQVYLLFLLLLPSLRRLLYLSEYPRFVRDNADQLAESPEKFDSEFQRLFIRFSFAEAIAFPIVPAIIQTVTSGSSVFAFIFPWIFYLFGEFFILAIFTVVLKLLGQFTIPKTLFKLHLIGKPVSEPPQDSKPESP